MRAEIKGFHSPDIFELEKYYPEEENNFCFLLQILVGPKNEKGDETFDITVCTPQWLISNYKKDDVIFGRHYLIVFEYNYKIITNRLQKFVDTIEADNWDEIALKISRIGMWEFEDYQK